MSGSVGVGGGWPHAACVVEKKNLEKFDVHEDEEEASR